VKSDIELKPLSERFDHLVSVISGERFLKMQGLNNEVPFFICPYRAEEALDMARIVGNVKKQLSNDGVQVLHINFYDLSIELLRSRDIFESLIDSESSVSKDELKELLQGVLDPQAHLIPAISEKMSNTEFDVLFLSGVGEVFPYLRSHNILNNLQSSAKDKPTVMFFPGSYSYSDEDGASLDLFGRLHDDKYYRAFNIYRYET
jgi:hypothetical protein